MSAMVRVVIRVLAERFRSLAWLVAVGSAALVPGCDVSKTVVADPTPASVEAASDRTLSATVGSALGAGNLPSVVVRDEDGAPMAGIPVTFSLTAGGGSISGSSATTSSSGVATLGGWTLATVAGPASVTATVAGLVPITFDVTGVAGPATKLVFVSAPAATVVNRAILSAVSVQLKDVHDNNATTPVSSVTASVSSGGSLTGTATVSTGSGGTATFSNLLYAGSVGTKTLTFAATGLTSAMATVSVAPAPGNSLTIIAGNNQTGTAGELLTVKPAVKVSDADGNGVPDVPVTFAVATGNGVAFGTSQTTDALGQAQVSEWSLGAVAGSNTLTATTTTPSATVTFSATGAAGAPVLLAVSAGNNQTGTAGSPTAVKPAVKVSDANGNGVPGITVTFAVASGGGTATGASKDTDASGVATITDWSLGTVAGTNTLTASIASPNTTVTFTATGDPGPAAKLTFLQQPSTSARNRIPFASQPTVRLVDINNNNVSQSGVTVTASIASGGGTLGGVVAAATNASGVAAFSNLSVAGTVGSRQVKFSATGVTADSAAVDITAGVPTQLAATTGLTVTGVTGTAASPTPAVKVSDADGNGVPGVSVSFVATAGGGQVLGPAATTGSDGVAAPTSWILGPDTISNTLSVTTTDTSASGAGFTGATAGTLASASISGTPVLFTATPTERPACSESVSHTIGTTTNGTLDPATDCLRNVTGPYAPLDRISITTATPAFFSVTMASAAFTVRQSARFWGTLLRFDGDFPTSNTVNYLVAAGTWTIEATSGSANATGAYSFTTVSNPSSTGCINGVVSGTIGFSVGLDTQCNYTTNAGNSAASKVYQVMVPTGTTLTVTMSSTDFIPKIEVYRVNSNFSRTFVSATNSGASPVAVALTPGGALYEIRATHEGAGGPLTGNLILSFAP